MIKGLLKTNPSERLNIEDVLKCNWVKVSKRPTQYLSFTQR